MTFYPLPVNEKFRAPRRAGCVKNANAVGARATFVCGAVLRFTLRIDRKKGKILEAKFQTDGCGFSIAAAEVLAEKITGKHLSELHGLDKSVLRREIEVELEKFEDARKHCLDLSLDALQAAFASFRAAQMQEWTGDAALICTCFGVSEDTIEQVVSENALETAEQVTMHCSAGGGCGSCQVLIQEIIDIFWREQQ